MQIEIYVKCIKDYTSLRLGPALDLRAFYPLNIVFAGDMNAPSNLVDCRLWRQRYEPSAQGYTGLRPP